MKKQYKITLAAGWLALVTSLFFLPGSALPRDDFFDRIALDKWVHISIFFVLMYLWSWSLQLQDIKSYVVILLVASTYGYFIEVIQDQFIPHRSFDPGDVIADIIGSLAGIGIWNRHKKIDPCRNRGRNQN